MTHIDLADQTAIVTGAARGIGLAIAARLLDSGARVSLWDRDGLDEAASLLAGKGEVHTAAVDVTDFAAVEAAAKAVQARFGGIDILVNNAGITGGNRPSWETPVEE